VDLVCRLTTIGDSPVVTVAGELDLASAPELRNALVRAISDHRGATVTVDLDGVSALDDTGLGVLLGAAGRAREAGGDLVLVTNSTRLRSRFELTGLSRAIEVRDRTRRETHAKE
jgi:anti-sigma B factor antagonist